MATENTHFAWCNHSECENKDECLRYSEDEKIMYIKFENLLNGADCKYFIQKELPIATTDENVGDDKNGEV